MGMFDTVDIGQGNSFENLNKLEGQSFQIKDMADPIMRYFLIEDDRLYYVSKDHKKFHYDHFTSSITLNLAHVEPDPQNGYLHIHFYLGKVVGEFKSDSMIYPVPQYEQADLEARFDFSTDHLDAFFGRLRDNMKAIPVYRRIGMAVVTILEDLFDNFISFFKNSFRDMTRTIRRFFP